MVEVTLTMTDEQATKVSDAFVSTWPIPKDDNNQPLFTKQQWVKKCLIRHIKDVHRQYQMDCLVDQLQDEEIVA